MAKEFKLNDNKLPRATKEFILPLAIATINPAKYFLPKNTDQADAEVGQSYLGTPVLSNIVFASGSYEQDGKTIDFGGIQLDTVIMAITQTKKVIKTAVQGFNGTVKEYVSDGDYSVTINGVMTTRITDKYPAFEVEAFLALMKVPEALEFTSEFIDRFGSFNLVVESYSLPQTEGFRNSQAFTIQMVTDRTIELQLLEEE